MKQKIIIHPEYLGLELSRFEDRRYEDAFVELFHIIQENRDRIVKLEDEIDALKNKGKL